MKLSEKRLFHRIFQIGIFIKGIDGFLEIIGGILLFLASSNTLAITIKNFFQHELIQDPNDLMANIIITFFQNLSTNSRLFAAFYLLIHGIIKLGLVIALWKKKIWAYPLAGGILIILVIYQIIRFFRFHSYLLLLLTGIDIIIIILLRLEYQKVKAETFI